MSASKSAIRVRAATALGAAVAAFALALVVLPHAADAAPARVAAPLATATTSCNQGYGCPTSSTQVSIQATCSLSTTSAAAGTKVTGTLSNVPAGTQASLLFDGSQVASGTADASGVATVPFTVPSSATAGSGHTVVFSGAGFSCDTTAGAGFQVLGASTSRGGLSTTGIEVATYLAVALVLIVVGLQLVRVARARRRRAGSRRNGDRLVARR